MKKRIRQKYTYIPNKEIESITTWNNVTIPGDKLLDGAYAKGKVKFGKGGEIKLRIKNVDSFDKHYDEVGFTKSELSLPKQDENNIWYATTKDKSIAEQLIADGIVEKYARGGGVDNYLSVEQEAQALIGERWFEMSEDQRAKSVSEFVTEGVIESRKYAKGGMLFTEVFGVIRENDMDADTYETQDDLTVYSTNRNEIEALASYLNIPPSKIRDTKDEIKDQEPVYYIILDKTGTAMAHGGMTGLQLYKVKIGYDGGESHKYFMIFGKNEFDAMESAKSIFDEMYDDDLITSISIVNKYLTGGSMGMGGAIVGIRMDEISDDDFASLKEIFEEDDVATDFNDDETVIYFHYDELSAENQKNVRDIVLTRYKKGGGVKAKGKYRVTYTVGKKMVVKTYDSKDEMDDGIASFYETNVDVDDIKIEEIGEEEEAKPNIFAIAKEVKKKTKATEKDVVTIEGIESDIDRLEELRRIQKNAKAEEEIVKGKLREVAREKFLEMYISQGRRPDNFKIADGDKDVLFIVQDNYIKVSPEKEELLKEYEGLLGEQTSYTISSEMLKKKGRDGRNIGDIISDLILKSKDISDDDKMNLFKVERKVGIKDGAIDRLLDYDNPEEIYSLIQPIEVIK